MFDARRLEKVVFLRSRCKGQTCGRTLGMDTLSFLLRPGLAVKKVIGKLRRTTVRFPDSPVIKMVNGAVRFEHKRLPFLTEDNQLAMMTGSYDIILQEFLRKH